MITSPDRPAHQILAIVGQGFEEIELATYTEIAGWTRLVDGVPRCEISVAGFHETVRSKHGLRVVCDLSIDAAAARSWDAVYVPGGWPDDGYEEIHREPVLAILRSTHARGGMIATSCTGIFAVGEAGLLRGRRATTYVSPGGCAACASNERRLAGYGAIVCREPVVFEERILSDVGPSVGLAAALTFFRVLVGDDGIARLRRELGGAFAT